MAIITLKIDENSKVAQSFLAFLKNLTAEKKGIEIINTLSDETTKVIKKVEEGKGLNKVKNSADLFKQLAL